MHKFQPGEVPHLDPWGTLVDLGSEVLEGEGLAFGKMLFGAPDAPLSCAFFATGKGRFRMTYPFNEHAVVVEGSATLTNELTGIEHTFVPGDAWFVERGTPVLWEIHSDRFTKNYCAIA